MADWSGPRPLGVFRPGARDTPDVTGIEGWASGEHTTSGVTHPTYRKGSGPGVIVVSEIPGITEDVIAFADEVVELSLIHI